jgi:hypothetical protein
MRPSPHTASGAQAESHNDMAAAVLTAWIAPRAAARRRLVPDFKRLMKFS